MVYQGLASDFSESSLGYAVSDDGLTWRVGGDDPLIPVEAVPHATFLSNPVLLFDANDDLWLYFSAIHDDETPVQIYRVLLMMD